MMPSTLERFEGLITFALFILPLSVHRLIRSFQTHFDITDEGYMLGFRGFLMHHYLICTFLICMH